MPMRYAIFYISTLVACFAIDLVWLTQMNTRLYKPILGDILLDKPRLSAAIVFYLTYIAGVTIFVGIPALRAGSWRNAVLYGALFGLFCYATYDLTNQATLKSWSTAITVADIAWGMFLTGASASVGYIITNSLQLK
jgi:uncharacterized membrane protein